MTQIKEVAGVVRKILGSRESSIKKLIKKTGISERVFFEFADLRGADLRNQDLTGMSFFGSNVHGTIIDRSTKVDDVQFDFLRHNGAIFVDDNIEKTDNELHFSIPIIFGSERREIIDAIIGDIVNYRSALLIGKRGSGKTTIIEEIERVLRNDFVGSRSIRSFEGFHTYVYRLDASKIGDSDFYDMLMGDREFRDFIIKEQAYAKIEKSNKRRRAYLSATGQVGIPRIIMLCDNLQKPSKIVPAKLKSIFGSSVSVFATSSEENMADRFMGKKIDNSLRSVYHLPNFSKEECSKVILGTISKNKPEIRLNTRVSDVLYAVTGGNINLLILTLRELLKIKSVISTNDLQSRRIGIKETMAAISNLVNSGQVFSNDLFLNSFLNDDLMEISVNKERIIKTLLDKMLSHVDVVEFDKKLLEVSKLSFNLNNKNISYLDHMFEIGENVMSPDVRYLMINKILSIMK